MTQQLINPGKLMTLAQDQMMALVQNGRDSLANTVGELVGVVEEIAGRLDGPAAPVAAVLRDAAHSIDAIRSDIKDRDVEELIARGRTFVAEQPAVAAGIAALVGFVAMRLLKAASDEQG